MESQAFFNPKLKPEKYLLNWVPDGSGVMGVSISTEIRFWRMAMTSSMAGVSGEGVSKVSQLEEEGAELPAAAFCCFFCIGRIQLTTEKPKSNPHIFTGPG